MKINPSKKLGKVMREVDARAEPKVAAALFRAVQTLPSLQLKRLLVTTDFSKPALDGVRYAIWIARRFSASVLLTHVVERPPRFAGLESVIIARSPAEVTRQARGQLSRLLKQESTEGVELTSCIRSGKAFHEISEAAREHHIDLLVIATRGLTGLKRVLLGSTAERVIRHAPCSVLTVPATSRKARSKSEPGRLKRIVVPIDFSNLSLRALPYAAAFAKQFDAEIVLVHVVEPLIAPPESGYVSPHGADSSEEKLSERYLKRLRDEALGAVDEVQTTVCSGLPFQEITATATSLGADLILMTTHGHTGLKHALLGSTAERIIRYADCPVLIVREKLTGGKIGKRRGARRRSAK